MSYKRKNKEPKAEKAKTKKLGFVNTTVGKVTVITDVVLLAALITSIHFAASNGVKLNRLNGINQDAQGKVEIYQNSWKAQGAKWYKDVQDGNETVDAFLSYLQVQPELVQKDLKYGYNFAMGEDWFASVQNGEKTEEEFKQLLENFSDEEDRTQIQEGYDSAKQKAEEAGQPTKPEDPSTPEEPSNPDEPNQPDDPTPPEPEQPKDNVPVSGSNVSIGGGSPNEVAPSQYYVPSEDGSTWFEYQDNALCAVVVTTGNGHVRVEIDNNGACVFDTITDESGRPLAGTAGFVVDESTKDGIQSVVNAYLEKNQESSGPSIGLGNSKFPIQDSYIPERN